MATRPSTRKGTATVQPGKGVKINRIYYWHDALRHPEVERTPVPVRYDPFDIGVAYAYVQHRWVRCISQYFAQLHGYSEKALLLASAELRQRTPPPASRITAKHLADFLAKATTHEALLLQRLHDHEARRVLETMAGNPTPVEEGAVCPPPGLPEETRDGVDEAQRARVDMATLPVFEEYRSWRPHVLGRKLSRCPCLCPRLPSVGSPTSRPLPSRIPYSSASIPRSCARCANRRA